VADSVKRSTVPGAVLVFGLLASLAPGLRADERGARWTPAGPFSLAASDCPAPAVRGLILGDRRAHPFEKAAPAPPPGKKLGRAVLEFAAAMAAGQVWYNAAHRDIKPWQYHWTWKDQSERLFNLHTWRFDSNCYFLNWTHGPVGAATYALARSNYLNRLESALFTLAGSLYWESIAEWASGVSLNDHAFTILGGIPIGEAWHNLGEYFLSRSGLVNGIIGYLNPLLKFNRWLDRKAVPPIPRPPEPGWHDFRLSFGGWTHPSPGPGRSGLNAYAGIDAQLLGIPDAEKPGRVRLTPETTLFSQASFDLVTAGGRVEEIGFFFRSVYWGSFWKSIGPDLDGSRFYIGLGSAFRFFKQRSAAFYDSNDVVVKDIERLRLDEPRDFRDKFSAVHALGPVFDLTVREGPFRARATADAYLDFALVNALALNDYSRTHPIAGAKTTLVYYGYYYAWGGSLALHVDIEYGPWEARAFFRGHAWGSIEGRDHFQAEVTDDYHLTDARTFAGFRTGFRLWTSPLLLTAAAERIGRRGSIKDLTRREKEVRISAGLQLRY